MKIVKDLYASAEEYSPLVVDQFQRFRAYMSKNPNKMEPILSRHLFDQGFRPVYKDDKKYAVCISHDVDFLYDRKGRKAHLMDSARALKNRSLSRSVHSLKNLIAPGLNPDWLLEQFIDLELRHGIPATYYFLALQDGEEDFNYTMEAVQPYIKSILANGSEIGLHGGHEAFNSREKIAAERKILEDSFGSVTKGYRNHYLRFKTPDTWRHLQDLGFVYDTTFGYADSPGYRNGLCYPYRPFDLEKNAFMDILEIPLVVMDVTFWKYMGLSVEQSFILFKKIAGDVKKINGVLTILWHNNNLTGDAGRLFKKVFDHIVQDEDAWFANSLDLALFWKEKNLPVMEEMITSSFNTLVSNL